VEKKMIQVRFFASLRESIGLSAVKVEYSGEKTVSELLVELMEKGESWRLLKEQEVLVAVNQTLCGKDAKVNDGDEVAFFPPVTGG
jgi:molybdopterin synthase sulfur carrier subunit